MHVHSTNNVLVSLSASDIETIISALETDWNEWKIQSAGILLSQFQQLKGDLAEQITDISNDSI